MNKSIVLLLIISITASIGIVNVQTTFGSEAISYSSSTGDFWSTKSSMPTARNGEVAEWNGTIYVFGGYMLRGPTPPNLIKFHDFTNTNEKYDPATDTWTSKAPMPTSRECFAIVAYENKIYCIGGRTNNGSYTGINEVYDPINDTWENKTAMPTARDLLTANVVNGKIYLIGGEPNGYLNEVYDPHTDSWETKKPVLMGANDHASAVVDNKIYVLGGHPNGTNNQIYDPQTDSWSQGNPLPISAFYASCGVTSGDFAPKEIYVFGITGPELFYTRYPQQCVTEIYNPQNDTWIVGKTIPSNRFDFGTAVIKDMLYVIGGHSYEKNLGYIIPSVKNEQYTPIGYQSVPSSTNSSVSATSPIDALSAKQLIPFEGAIVALVIIAMVGGYSISKNKYRR